MTIGPVGPAAGLMVSGELSWTTKGLKTCARGLAKFCAVSMQRLTAELSLARGVGDMFEGVDGVFGPANEGEGSGWEFGDAWGCCWLSKSFPLSAVSSALSNSSSISNIYKGHEGFLNIYICSRSVLHWYQNRDPLGLQRKLLWY